MRLLLRDWNNGGSTRFNLLINGSRTLHVLPGEELATLALDVHFLEVEPLPFVRRAYLLDGVCLVH